VIHVKQTEMDRRIEHLARAWLLEARALCDDSFESSALVLASVTQLLRFAIEWQPPEHRERMREKVIKLVALHGTSCEHIDHAAGRVQ
jgi:hypothetical protein